MLCYHRCLSVHGGGGGGTTFFSFLITMETSVIDSIGKGAPGNTEPYPHPLEFDSISNISTRNYSFEDTHLSILTHYSLRSSSFNKLQIIASSLRKRVLIFDASTSDLSYILSEPMICLAKYQNSYQRPCLKINPQFPYKVTLLTRVSLKT